MQKKQLKYLIINSIGLGIGVSIAKNLYFDPAAGLKQIFAGMNEVGTGIVGAPLTGGSSFVISVAGATAVAVGLVQTGYGTSVFCSSRNNFKSKNTIKWYLENYLKTIKYDYL